MAVSDETVESLGTSPKKTVTDEGLVEERKIDEVIQADRYTKSRTAGAAVPWGLRIAKVRTPGAS